MTTVTQWKDQEFLSLETFRKNGVGVKSPMWFAQEGDLLYLWTISDSAKVKRIRNNPQVNIAPCQRFGEVTGAWVSAHASVDESVAAVQHVETLLSKKVGIGYAIFRLIDRLRDKQRGAYRVCITLSLT